MNEPIDIPCSASSSNLVFIITYHYLEISVELSSKRILYFMNPFMARILQELLGVPRHASVSDVVTAPRVNINLDILL